MLFLQLISWSFTQVICRIAHVNFIVLPKSSNFERMKENMILDDIAISEEDMWKIRTMPQVGWGGEHPDCERIYF